MHQNRLVTGLRLNPIRGLQRPQTPAAGFKKWAGAQRFGTERKREEEKMYEEGKIGGRWKDE